MSNRTRLNITPSIKEYAKSFGARFDRRLKEWYVEGSVPAELEELVCREIRSRDYVSEVSPSCPICGNKMVFRSGANYQFWGCSRFPVCRATLEVGKSISPIQHVLSHLQSNISSSNQKSKSKSETDILVNDRRKAVIALAIVLFGSEHQAMRWLTIAKVSLGNVTPLDFMTSIVGCDRVELLLKERFA